MSSSRDQHSQSETATPQSLEDELQAHQPPTGPALWAMGLLALERLNWEAATKHLRQAATALSSAEPLAELAAKLLEDKQFVQARRVADEALKVDPKSDVANYILGSAILEQHQSFSSGKQRPNRHPDVDAALQAFDAVGPTSLHHADAVASAAIIRYEWKGDIQGALALTDKAMWARPGDLTILGNYAELLVVVRQPHDAKRLALRLLRHKNINQPEFVGIAPLAAVVMLVAALQTEDMPLVNQMLELLQKQLESDPSTAEESSLMFGQLRTRLKSGKLLDDASGAQAPLADVLEHVESGGKKGSLAKMQKWARSRQKS